MHNSIHDSRPLLSPRISPFESASSVGTLPRSFATISSGGDAVGNTNLKQMVCPSNALNVGGKCYHEEDKDDKSFTHTTCDAHCEAKGMAMACMDFAAGYDGFSPHPPPVLASPFRCPPPCYAHCRAHF
eukprot:2617064-Rhodomonas_salina.4